MLFWPSVIYASTTLQPAAASKAARQARAWSTVPDHACLGLSVRNPPDQCSHWLPARSLTMPVPDLVLTPNILSAVEILERTASVENGAVCIYAAPTNAIDRARPGIMVMQPRSRRSLTRSWTPLT